MLSAIATAGLFQRGSSPNAKPHKKTHPKECFGKAFEVRQLNCF